MVDIIYKDHKLLKTFLEVAEPMYVCTTAGIPAVGRDKLHEL